MKLLIVPQMAYIMQPQRCAHKTVPLANPNDCIHGPAVAMGSMNAMQYQKINGSVSLAALSVRLSVKMSHANFFQS
jgi:hypothetical protein